MLYTSYYVGQLSPLDILMSQQKFDFQYQFCFKIQVQFCFKMSPWTGWSMRLVFFFFFPMQNMKFI